MMLNWLNKLKQQNQDTDLIKFGLPNLLNNFFINRYLIMIQRQNPHYLYDNHKIDFVYGCFPYSIWSLNRKNKYTHISTIETTLKFYEQNNISVKLMFNNEMLTKEQLYDTFSNIILKKAHNKNNSVFAASDLLGEYIKKNYPLFNIIKITDLKNNKWKNILIDGYYNQEINVDKLKNRKSTYITLNPICSNTCKLYNYHKQYLGNEQIHYCINEPNFPCELKNHLTFYNLFENKNFITLDRLKELKKQGINNYLIADNELQKSINSLYNNYNLIESYLYYLIKPEFQEHVRNLLIKEYKSKEQVITNRERQNNEKV